MKNLISYIIITFVGVCLFTGINFPSQINKKPSTESFTSIGQENKKILMNILNKNP